MGEARLALLALLAAGFFLAGILAPKPAIAADEWQPIVVQLGQPVARSPKPPVPHAKRPATKIIPPAVSRSQRKGVADPVASVSEARAIGGDIVTGAIGAVPATRVLSAADSARLVVATAGERQGAESGGPIIPDTGLAQSYCINIADAAADARIAWQKAKLEKAEQELRKRIAALEAKEAEYKVWLKRRDEFSEKANETLVQIYARMEPDAAAPQLIAMDEETAAAVLTKLDPRNASAILNEMQPDKAARLTSTIAGAARKKTQDQRAAYAAQQRPRGGPAEPNQGGPRQ
jgi:flagellar motility protein MotE (MotC chaperone)